MSAKTIPDRDRDPSDYHPSAHFLTRFRREYGSPSATRTNPPITAEVVEKCIQRGRVSQARNDCLRFEADIDATAWTLIADGSTDTVLTAYAPDHHNSAWARDGGGRL